MASNPNQNDLIGSYLQRAFASDDRRRNVASAQFAVNHNTQGETPRVFNGTFVPPGEAGYASPNNNEQRTTENKKFSRRNSSTFNRILVLIASAVVIVLYIGNIIRVGELLFEIGKLQDAHQRNVNEQEILRAQINRMSNLDRIQSLAESRVGLITPKQSMQWLELDQTKIQDVEEGMNELHQQRARRK